MLIVARSRAIEGLGAPSVANCDSLMTIPKPSLGRRIGTLSRDRRPALDHALAYVLEGRSLR